MIYNIHYDICALIVTAVAIVCISIKKELRKPQNKMFLIILCLLFVTAVFDIWSAAGISYPNIYSRVTRNFLSYTYIILHNSMAFFFTSYVAVVTGVYKRKKLFYWVLFSIPTVAPFVLIMMNFSKKWIFYYTSTGEYYHGNMFVVLYACAFIYMLISVIYLLFYRNSVPKSKKFTLLVFVISTTVAIVIEIKNPTLLVQLFGESVAFTAVMFTIENEDEIYNGITGIYNRKAFLNECNEMINHSIPSVIIVSKMNNMNYYNATFGVVFINRMKRVIAQWLNKISKDCKAFDIDNDHFAIICSSDKDIVAFIEVIKTRFMESWTCENISIKFRTQICVIKVPTDVNDINKLLFVTDAPNDKSDSECEVIYADQLSVYQKELKIEHAVNKALIENTFKVFYQPIWSSAKNKISSAEALIRLFDDELGFISPEIFIPIAERNGTIVPIGRFVFEEVCRFYSENRLDRIGVEYIEVNLSVVQCMDISLVDTFLTILNKYNLDSSRINLEITESAFANNTKMLEDTMNRLSSAGFSFSMDDYGTGYSNFSYMFDMPFHIVKLDKSILWNADKNMKAAVLLKNTVIMIKEMNLQTVVEGVETEDQKNVLFKLGCDYLQGYYFSRPIPEKDFYYYCLDFNLSEYKLN